MSELLQQKKKLAQAIRTLAGGGVLTLTVGHASCRLEDGRILMLGHAHRSHKTLDSITEEEIIVVDGDGKVVEGNYEPPGEVYIHTEVLRARPDVGSVVHGHPMMSEVFGIAGRPIVAVDHRSAMFASGVPVMDFAGQVDSPELGRQVAEVLGDCTAMLLRGHGQVVVGETLEGACANAFLLEDNATKLFMALQLGGGAKALRPDEMRKHKPTSVWAYYVKKFDPMFGAVGQV